MKLAASLAEARAPRVFQRILKMSDDSVDSTVDEEKEKKRARGGRTEGIARRLKTLFCCLKREPDVKGIVKYDPDECDYIVEKLVVRRVPLALFAVPADLSNTSREAPTRLGANEILRLADKRRDSVGGRLERQAKSSVWQERISNRFNVLHPDLKGSKYPLEDPLNFSHNSQLFTEDISEVTSSTRTDVSSRTSSVTVQDDVSNRDNSIHCESSNPAFENEKMSCAERDEATRDVSSGKEQNKFVLGRNRKYIVSPFRVRRGSFNLAKPKDVIGDLGVDGKSLSYIEESLENKSSNPMGDIKDCNLESNTAVRWRITIRRQRANTALEYAVSEPCPSLEGKIHR